MYDHTSDHPPLPSPAPGHAGDPQLAGALTALARELAAAHRRVQDGETVTLAPAGATLVDLCGRLQKLPPGEGRAYMAQLDELARLLDWLQEAIGDNLNGLNGRLAAIAGDKGS